MNNNEFQTPMYVAKYMVDFIDFEPKLILEPSIGNGNLIKALWAKFPNCKVIGYDIKETLLKDDRLIFRKQDFLEADVKESIDLILSNPPFTPMTIAYKFFEKCISIQVRGIYLMPYLFLINSSNRSKKFSQKFNLKNIVNLPRSVFKNSRIQCCLLDIHEGKTDVTNYKWYDEELWESEIKY